MILKNIKKFVAQKSYLKVFLVIITLAIIGLSTVGNYGLTWDEKVEVDMVQQNLRSLQTKEELPIDIRYYGFIFNYTANVLFEVKESITQTLFPQSNPNIIPQDEHQKELQIIDKKLKFKHIVIFLFSLLAYLSVAGIVSILAGKEYAWLGALSLALFPSFWGHSFFNPKDIPFATLFILSTWLGAYLINFYAQVPQENLKIGKNKVTYYSVLYGALVGLLTGIRVGGFFVLFFFIGTHLLLDRRFKFLQKISRFWKFYSIVILSWALTTILIYPASWYYPGSPIKWFIDALIIFSKYSIWDNKVLFDGQNILGSLLPWYYYPRLLSITLPLIFSVTFIIGLIWIISRYRKLTILQQACFILVVLQIFFLPTIAIVKQAIFYDGIRHILFVIPGIAAISATALSWLYQAISQKFLKRVAIVVLVIIFSGIAFDMAKLHPYEYAYFNRISGGLAKANNRYETDYWALSLREGIEWINRSVPDYSKVVMTGPMYVVLLFANPDKHLDIVHLDDFNEGVESNPDYYLALHRFGYEKAFAECPVVYQVARQGVPFTSIKQCFQK